MGDRGVWDASRARKAGILWAVVAVVLATVVMVICTTGAWLPGVWTRGMWSEQRAVNTTTEYQGVEPDTEYEEVVALLGPVSYEAPGFTIDGHVVAAVCVWQNTDAGEVRGMFIDGRLVGSLLVFE